MRRAVPVVLTAIIFAVIFLRIPFDRFVEALEHARLVPFVSLIGSFSLFYFAIDTLVLATLVRWFHGPIRYRDLLPARAVTYLVSIANTQLAQGALALYLHRRFATPLGELAGTIAVLILLEVTQLVLFACAGMALSPSHVPLELVAAPLAVAAVWGASRSRCARHPAPRPGRSRASAPFPSSRRSAASPSASSPRSSR